MNRLWSGLLEAEITTILDNCPVMPLSKTKWGVAILENVHSKCRRFHTSTILAASSWVSCACGRLSKNIPRKSPQGKPKDELLSKLGVYFYRAIRDGRPKIAAKVLVRIEVRANEILTKPHLIAQKGAS